MASNTHTYIRIRRTQQDLEQEVVKGSKPKFGEMIYVEPDKSIFIGDSDESRLDQLGRVRVINPARANNLIFNKGSDEIYKHYIVDEDGNTLSPWTSAEHTSYSGTTYTGNDTVAKDLDLLDKKTKNLSPYSKSYAYGDADGNALKPVSKVDNTTKTLYVTGVDSANAELHYNSGVCIDASKGYGKGILKGAAWNDYAELRLCTAKPGECVVEQGNGQLNKSEKRLQKGCAIVSDTYGMIIGTDSEYSSPIAVSGRVLAKCYNKKKIKVGDPVCSGYDGSISRMNRLECILFPDRIIGYVSEIPTYDVWNDVNVAGRIWIKVK